MFEVFCIFVLLIIGIVLILKGGDYVVDVTNKLSDITNINEILIGSSLLSFASTMPELVITILGISENKVNLVLGNVFGTILVNICLVLGVSLCFIRLKRVNKKTLEKLFFMVFLILLVSLCAVLNILNIFTGLIFLILFFIYFSKIFLDIKKELKVKTIKTLTKSLYNIENSKNEISANLLNDFSNKNLNVYKKSVAVRESLNYEKIKYTIKFVVGILLLFAGAQIIVITTTNLSNLLKINSLFFGLTFIAVGTSLPELIISIKSIKKKRLNLALGNIIGANIINLSLSFAMSLILSGIGGLTISNIDLLILLPVALIASLILAIPILLKKQTYFWQGVTLISLYAIYCIIIILALC